MNQFSLFKGTTIASCNSLIQNSNITTTAISRSSINSTTINMNGGVIVNAGTPVNPTDVVNKNYVDNALTNYDIYNITLTNTNFTQIIPKLFGSITLNVTSNVSGGPSATFSASKNTANKYPSIVRFTSGAGIGTYERLEISWPPNSGILLRKNGVNYDGGYICNLVAI
jgi:hypothetical protein